MQSDVNSIYGDVVLASFNMVYSDEDKIQRPKIFQANLLGSLLWRFKILRLIEEYAYLKKCST